jgi:peptide methionine sulfoxide reductase MsrB
MMRFHTLRLIATFWGIVVIDGFVVPTKTFTHPSYNAIVVLQSKLDNNHDNNEVSTNESSENLTTDRNRIVINRRSMIYNTAASTAAVVASSVVTSLYLFGNDNNVANARGVTNGSIVYGNDPEIMYPKEHGTSATAVQSPLRYNVDNALADKICNYNRHFAEPAGYFLSKNVNFVNTLQQSPSSNETSSTTTATLPLTFYDSVTGAPLFTFVASPERTIEDFLRESQYHGWPSFRDADVRWDHVRVLRNSGEVVSTTGTHLGHNLPDKQGNRYCINLVSIAGQPTISSTTSA